MTMTLPIKQKLTNNIRAKYLPYWKESFRDQRLIHVYKNMDPVTVSVPVKTIHSLVNITMENFHIVYCQFKPGVKKYEIFNDMVRKSLPAQLSPLHSNRKCHQVPCGDGKSRHGQKSLMDLVVHFNGVCEIHVHGFPAILDGGFEKLALTVAGNKIDPTAPLKVSFENKCIHENDRNFGCLSGSARWRR